MTSARDWQCHRTGDCCRNTSVFLSTQEWEAVAAANPEAAAKATTQPGGKAGFLHLSATPACPFLDGATCTVYDQRPYVCRRFVCYRESPAEPLVLNPRSVLPVNCAERCETRDYRRDFEKRRRHALRWAYAHGWPAEMR